MTRLITAPRIAPDRRAKYRHGTRDQLAIVGHHGGFTSAELWPAAADLGDLVVAVHWHLRNVGAAWQSAKVSILAGETLEVQDGSLWAGGHTNAHAV